MVFNFSNTFACEIFKITREPNTRTAEIFVYSCFGISSWLVHTLIKRKIFYGNSLLNELSS